MPTEEHTSYRHRRNERHKQENWDIARAADISTGRAVVTIAERGAAAIDTRMLWGNAYAAWYVPRGEVFTLSAATLRARAEAEGWEQFTYELPIRARNAADDDRSPVP